MPVVTGSGALEPIREEPNGTPSRRSLHAERAEAAQGCQRVCCVTVNVQTFDPGEQRRLRQVGLRISPRMAFVDDFLRARGAMLVGIQGARLAESGCMDLPSYFAYTCTGPSRLA